MYKGLQKLIYIMLYIKVYITSLLWSDSWVHVLYTVNRYHINPIKYKYIDQLWFQLISGI